MSEKFDNLILYVCTKSQEDANFGRTKLNKLLYFADFGYYRDHGQSISGQEYMAIQNGPVPRAMKPVLDRMLHANDIREERIDVGLHHPLCKPIAVSKPDMTEFKESETVYIDGVIDKYARMNGTELANLSHAEPGYKAAYECGTRQAIQYGTAYLAPFVNITPEVVDRTKELAEVHKWHVPATT